MEVNIPVTKGVKNGPKTFFGHFETFRPIFSTPERTHYPIIYEEFRSKFICALKIVPKMDKIHKNMPKNVKTDKFINFPVFPL